MKSESIIKYIWLLDVVKRAGEEGISYAEINRKWQQSEFSNGETYPQRTFNNHREDIAKIFDVEIVCDKHTNRYYLKDLSVMDKSLTAQWIIDSYTVGIALSESKSLSNRIALEKIPYGQNHLLRIIQAIRENRKISFDYKKFNEENPTRRSKMLPYGVKVFERRWYLIAKFPHQATAADPNRDNALHSFALDRMQQLTLEEETFEMPEDFDISELYKGVYGIFREDNWWTQMQNVRIKVDRKACDYFRTLPLHESQQEVETCDEYAIFAYRLQPAYDFKQKLFSCMDEIEVLEPQTLRKEMKDIIAKMRARYE